MNIDEQGNQGGKRFGIGGILVGLVYILTPWLAYYGVAQWIGFWDGPDVGIGGRVPGICATYSMFAIIMIMGESLIEDLVKFMVFALACMASWSLFEPPVQAILMGVPVGAALPLLMRFVSPAKSAD